MKAVHYLVRKRGLMAGLYYRACDSSRPYCTRGRNKEQGSFSRKNVNCGNCKRADIYKRALKA